MVSLHAIGRLRVCVYALVNRYDQIVNKSGGIGGGYRVEGYDFERI